MHIFKTVQMAIENPVYVIMFTQRLICREMYTVDTLRHKVKINRFTQ